MALVSIHGLGKAYQQGEVEVQALQDIHLEIQEGEFSALVGPSGSGKTTLLNLIGGLDRPTTGTLSLNGQDIATLGESKLSAYRLFNIGFVFQAYNLVPVLSALENVEFVMVLQGRPAAECQARALRYLERVGLKDLAHRRPKALSGGQQQRLAVARALAGEPRLVLADEPTANLDTENALGLLDLMERLNQEEGITFLFSTHDPRVVAKARRVVTLKDGRINRESHPGAGHGLN
ncbi:MAG: ABC transporter ATP-binding protein [Deltaproteobacteria bacterium]|nr:ABC transporter ATP-binding protein [Deltaproteobacteria bacterium]